MRETEITYVRILSLYHRCTRYQMLLKRLLYISRMLSQGVLKSSVYLSYVRNLLTPILAVTE
jgi:hypothetical protein